MRFFKSIRAWWRGLFRKRRFNMLNATDNSEEWHMHLSPASIFAAFLSFVLLLFILILSLVAYSPILELLPGYRTEADRSRESLVQNIIRLDSMERMMNRTSKVLVMPSPEDSILRAQMEGDGPYAIAGRSGGSRRSVREAIELAKPVEGIITDRFDIRNGNFGVRIAAAASDRITAIDNGTVVLSLWTPETGYMVELQHANNLLSVYKGLSQSLVTTGQTIRAGEMVGYNAEAEEGEVRLFEFELWNNGKPVDPEGYIVF